MEQCCDPSEMFGKLKLCWRTACFLPVLQEDGELRTVCEILDGEKFSGCGRRYWSIPERLMDLRWLSGRAGGAETADWAVETEYTLCRIVSTLGAWAGSAWKNMGKLRLDRAGDEAWNTVWRRNEALVRRCAARRKNGALHAFTEDELLRLYQMLLDLPPLPGAAVRGRPFRAAAQRLRKGLEDTFGLALERERSLLLFTGEDLQRNAGAAVDFCGKALEFFEGALWRKELTAAARLRKLSADLEQLQPDLPPAGSDVWSGEYHRALWLRLQAVADGVCRRINGEGEGDLAERAESVWRTMKDRSPVSFSLREYAADESRCAALLETDSGVRVLAFAGFWDCEDRQVQQSLMEPAEYDGDTAKAFRRIAAGLGAELAVCTSGTVDRMARYAVNRACRLEAAATLRQELVAGIPDRKTGKFLRSSYACCERKLLAHLAERGAAVSERAVLHTKFAPCVNCCAALRQWADGSGICLTLDCPQLI